MSLVACPDCGQPVSNQAAQCPGCGFPFRPPSRRNPAMTCGVGCLVAGIVGMALLFVFGIVAAIAVPAYLKSRDAARCATCVRHLEEIAELKADWVAAHQATNGAVIPEADLIRLSGGGLAHLSCPKDARHSFQTSYLINPVGLDPVCPCDETHSLAAEADDE